MTFSSSQKPADLALRCESTRSVPREGLENTGWVLVETGESILVGLSDHQFQPLGWREFDS